MLHPEHQYLDLLSEILERGAGREDRTGVGTRGAFGRQIRFDLAAGFPLLTTKRVHWKSVVVELLWMLRGATNVEFLHKHGVSIWDEWADVDGELGPVYGAQWRSFGAWRNGPEAGDNVDQIARAIDSLRHDPNGRRHLVTAWNPQDVEDMALPPCHCLFQFHVADGRLSCQLYQRSADIFLGVPFNIASYALLTSMIAQVTDLKPGEFIHTFGDVHLYNNHVEQARLQLSRAPRPFPTLVMARKHDIDSFAPVDFALVGYDPHPSIPAPVAV